MARLHQNGTSSGWHVQASKLSLMTSNPIREVVENLKLTPNPDKPFITLSIGDPTCFGNFRPSNLTLNAVKDSLRVKESWNYGQTVGNLKARQAVAEYYSARQNSVSANDVVLCSGCSHAIDIVISVIASPGQNILVPRPGYMIHKTIGEGLGIKMKYYDLLPDCNWEVDLEHLENQIDGNSVAIVINNPSNPCGSVYTKDHLREILKIASKYRVPVIADEIYENFVFSGYKYTAMSSLSDDVPIITCSGLTKRFLVPGWRMGWFIIHDKHNVLAKDVRRGLLNMCARILGPNTLIQQALPAILKNTEEDSFNEMMLFIENQAKRACKMLKNAPGLRPIMPQGSMYLMVQIKIEYFPKFTDDFQFIKQLCSQQSILCIPGKCFNYQNFMRIVLTVPENILIEACGRIIVFCKTHFTDVHKII
ncbi:tyrosine aminotransferase [Manduca sexta]|uniref:Tyrosine aminotransferase n=1 Tax=Manduca sexta TaxID=7130 RepID=A0A921ZSV5_MANSE|nr:tyrosine aminotransferase [Manduca sexta]KAG6462819.1 hypothetical protein O3G_MSEX013481 [Manduca sexta]